MSTGLAAARRYIEIGRPAQALASLATLDSDELDSHDAHGLRGCAFLELKDFERAAECARAGLEDAPASPDLLAVLSQAEAWLGRLAQAEATILAALEHEPDDVTFLCHYAEVLMRGAQLAKAERILRLAAESDPEAPDWREGLITLAYLHGEDWEARRLSEELLSLEPESIHGNRMLGAQDLNEGRAAAAAKRFGEVVRSQPGDDQFASEARAARTMARNPVWWPTLFFARSGSGFTWVCALVLSGGLYSAGAETVAAVALLVVLAVWLWAMIAPPLLGRPGS